MIPRLIVLIYEHISIHSRKDIFAGMLAKELGVDITSFSHLEQWFHEPAILGVPNFARYIVTWYKLIRSAYV